MEGLSQPKWFANTQWQTYSGTRQGFLPNETWHWLHTDPYCTWSGDPIKWQDKPDMLGMGDEFWRVGCARSPVMEPAIPALVWLGFREIYLLGVDHTPNDHIYEADGFRNQRISSADVALRNMVSEAERYGVTIWNCSPGSKAPVPYMPLEDVLNGR